MMEDTEGNQKWNRNLLCGWSTFPLSLGSLGELFLGWNPNVNHMKNCQINTRKSWFEKLWQVNLANDSLLMERFYILPWWRNDIVWYNDLIFAVSFLLWILQFIPFHIPSTSAWCYISRWCSVEFHILLVRLNPLKALMLMLFFLQCEKPNLPEIMLFFLRQKAHHQVGRCFFGNSKHPTFHALFTGRGGISLREASRDGARDLSQTPSGRSLKL